MLKESALFHILEHKVYVLFICEEGVQLEDILMIEVSLQLDLQD